MRISSALAAVVAISLTLILLAQPLHGGSHYLLYIYGSEGCPHCNALKNYFYSWYGTSNTYFCRLEGEAGCAERFLSFCSAIGLSPSIPLTFVVVDGGVRSVVFGEVGDKSFWDSLLSLPESNEIPLYLGKELGGYIMVDNLSNFSRALVPEYFSLRPSAGAVAPLPITQALTALTALALSDAVNPCVIFIYTLLLIATSIAFSRKGRVLIVGVAFISAVFIGYYALGLGLMVAVRGFPKELLSLVAVAFGVWICVSGIMGKSRMLAKESIYGLVGRASTSTTASFALGMLLTFTLLPCSAGPYVVFAGIASKYSPPLPYLLLAIYNLIFISPLLLVLLVIMRTMKYRAVQDALIRHGVKLSVAAGALLIAVGLWILLI